MSPTRNSMAHHVRVSSVGDISYALPSSGASADTSEAIQTIVTGRKCWKTIKGKGEVVWPPHLEAALVKGLERYRPVDTRSARALGRFPMRNKFISDFIHETTGVRRTPKQVGSRLQQLRDTCEGKRILKLLTHRPEDPQQPPRYDSPSGQQDSPAPTPVPRDVVSLHVLPPNTPWTGVASTSANSLDNIPRPLRQINPVVTFRSAKALTATSYCRVLCNGRTVYDEHTPLELTSTSTQVSTHYASDHECLFLYGTTLVPGYWRKLCEFMDIGSYSIIQDIVRVPSASSPLVDQGQDGEILFSVAYQFFVGSGMSPPQSPVSSNGDRYSYSSASSPELSAELDDLNMLNSFSETSLSTPPPHSPSLSRGAYYREHQQQTPRRTRPYPVDVPPPPSLIRDGEEGYASSLPTSPLDMAFSNVVHHGQASLPAPEPVASLCSAFADVAGYPTASFDVTVAYAPAVSDSLHSPGGAAGHMSFTY